MLKKTLLLPFLLFGSLSAEDISVDNVLENSKTITDISPKFVTYLDKSYLDLGEKGFKNITKLESSSQDSCVLLENKIVYCEYGESEEIRLKLKTTVGGVEKYVHVFLVQREVVDPLLPKGSVSDTVESLREENIRLKAKLDNLHAVLEKQKGHVAEAQRFKEELSECEKRVFSYDEIAKKNSERCEIEKTEILSLSKNKQYKSLKDYTSSTKQLMKIKEQQESIAELLAIIDKYKKQKSDSLKSKDDRKGFFNF